jgi:flavin reductase (DIM6/NTAB) family NADH-FMN oxidoreductase RutF
MECRLSQIIQLRDADNRAVETWLVLGQVVGVHIARNLLPNGVFDTAAADPVLRAGGTGTYFSISVDHRFEIARSAV